MADLEGSRTLRVDCDLLNRQETFIIGVTSIDAPTDDLRVSARGENVVCKEISPQAKLPDLLDVLASSSSITRVLVDMTKLLLK